MHINAISNGLGAQSMWLVVLACRRVINATLSITADTGWEEDRLWNTGERTSSREYFERVVVPLCNSGGILPRFVRSRDKQNSEMLGLLDYTRKVAKSGVFHSLNIPMFGSRNGRVMQRCTDKMKMRAVKQELKRMGATMARSAIGLHAGESARRVSGIYLRDEGPWSIYQTTQDKENRKPIKWLTHCYPLVDLNLNREDVQKLLVAEGIPYLVSTECDGCPHKDLPRWERTSPHVLAELAELESQFKGEFFFTSYRVPLMQAIELMRKKRDEKPDEFRVELDFGCKNNLCGI